MVPHLASSAIPRPLSLDISVSMSTLCDTANETGPMCCLRRSPGTLKRKDCKVSDGIASLASILARFVLLMDAMSTFVRVRTPLTWWMTPGSQDSHNPPGWDDYDIIAAVLAMSWKKMSPMMRTTTTTSVDFRHFNDIRSFAMFCQFLFTLFVDEYNRFMPRS